LRSPDLHFIIISEQPRECPRSADDENAEQEKALQKLQKPPNQDAASLGSTNSREPRDRQQRPHERPSFTDAAAQPRFELSINTLAASSWRSLGQVNTRSRTAFT
jgi:hypothetical protein